MTDGNDNSEGIGRRDALKAGVALSAMGVGLASEQTAQKAAASVQQNPERLTLGDEWILDDDGGSIQLKNTESGATLEYDENTGQWSVGSLATESLDTESYNNAEQVSQHDTVQAAFDAAGADGTVVFDPSGGPYSFTSKPSMYDGQTVILQADLVAGGSYTDVFFNVDNLTDWTLIPNGHTLDGTSRTGGAYGAVSSSNGSNPTDCTIEGVLRVKNMRGRAVNLYGTGWEVGTVIAETIGDPAANGTQGDVVNFGSTETSEDCHVDRVVGVDCARHTVAFGSKGPVSCTVGTILSTNPGGAHLTFEYAEECHVEYVHGTGARNAATYTSDLDYSGYGEVSFMAAGGNGTMDTVVETVVTKDAHGSGPGIHYAAGKRSTVHDATIDNPTGVGVLIDSNVMDSHCGLRRVIGGDDVGVQIKGGAEDTIIEGVGAGEIRECANSALLNQGDYTTLRGLHGEANHQGATSGQAFFVNRDITGWALVDCSAADGASGAQDTGINVDGSNTNDRFRIIGCDFLDCTSAYNLSSGTDRTKAANLPSPTL